MAHRPAVGPRELVGLVDEHVEGFLGLGDDETWCCEDLSCVKLPRLVQFSR